MAIFNSYAKLPEGICHRDHSENMNPRPIRKKQKNRQVAVRSPRRSRSFGG